MAKGLRHTNVQVFLPSERVTTFCKYHLNLFLFQRLSLFKEDALLSRFDLTPQTIEICLPPGHCFETVHIKVNKIHLVAGNCFWFLSQCLIFPSLAVSPLFHPRFLVWSSTYCSNFLFL